MASINYAFKEIISKIVYYGPGLSGKTSNLQYVFRKVPSNTRGELISLATDADRTLYFDFLPVNVGTVRGFATKFQLYTVPGQVYYNATRKLVLRGVDGLVFVADSQKAKMEENLESILNLKDNLAEYGYDINEIPLVIQYNKRDLPNILEIPELEAALNPRGLPSFEAVAVTGEGVFKTLKAISKIVLDEVRTRGIENAKMAKAKPAEAINVASAQSLSSVIAGQAALGDSNNPSASLISATIPIAEEEMGKTKSLSLHSNGESELPANVVVSDSREEIKYGRDEIPQTNGDGQIEKAVMQDEASELVPGLSHNEDGYVEKNHITQEEAVPSYLEMAFRRHDSGENQDDSSNSDLSKLAPLAKPRMAESVKVVNKGRGFNIFGWLRKKKKIRT
jgi:signal recognition particle receptor subunit beta